MTNKNTVEIKIITCFHSRDCKLIPEFSHCFPFLKEMQISVYVILLYRALKGIDSAAASIFTRTEPSRSPLII